jgi:hypothetical protein
VDAATFTDQGWYDIEMCLRNEHDKFVASKTSWYQESQQPCDAKDLGLT